MVEVNGLKFATSIGVLYALKEKRGHATLQETYKSVARTDMDNIMEVMCVCLEKGENKHITQDQFVRIIEEVGFGFLRLTKVFAEIIERLLYDGMSPEEIAESKKQLLAQATRS